MSISTTGGISFLIIFFLSVQRPPTQIVSSSYFSHPVSWRLLCVGQDCTYPLLKPSSRGPALCVLPMMRWRPEYRDIHSSNCGLLCTLSRYGEKLRRTICTAVSTLPSLSPPFFPPPNHAHEETTKLW